MDKVIFVWKILDWIFILSILISIVIRKSILSIVLIALNSISPFIKSIRGRKILYLLNFILSLGFLIFQICYNIIYMKQYDTEIDLTANSLGCNSIYDKTRFESIGIAWFACDSVLTIFIKMFADIIVIITSLLLLFYHYLMKIEYSQRFRFSNKLNKKIFNFIIDIITCIIIILIPIFNPNITSFIFIYAIVLYPIFKSITSFSTMESHFYFEYNLLRRINIILFYWTCILYLTFYYISDFRIIKDLINNESEISQYLIKTIFSHIIKNNNTNLKHISCILHIILIIILYIKLILIKSIKYIKANIIRININSNFYHLRIFIKQYSHSFMIIMSFIWVIIYRNYLSFVIVCLIIFPFIFKIHKKILIVQSLLLCGIYFFCVILQFVYTFALSKNYYIEPSYHIPTYLGAYTFGYTPFILFVKYLTFISSALSLNSLLDLNCYNINEFELSHFNNCPICENIIKENWLIFPNKFIQILTYLLTVFSRPIICVYPILKLYSNISNLNSIIIVGLFLLLSVTQAKKIGWENQQKICIQITNIYLSLWIILFYIIHTFGSMFNTSYKYINFICNMFDMNENNNNILYSPLIWFIISLNLNKFLLTYYKSVLISTNILVSHIDENIEWSSSILNIYDVIIFLFKLFNLKFKKLIYLLVLNRRLILCIICFIVSLVRPSLLTFIPFLLCCIYAISDCKKCHEIISSILIGTSVLIVLIMIIYQESIIPSIIFRPVFDYCNINLNESSIATGLSKTSSFAPIISFMSVVFIFSFLNSLSRYCDIINDNNNNDNSYIIYNFISYILHLLSNFITYYGYELLIISGLLSALQHSDVGSLLNLSFIIGLFIYHPMLYTSKHINTNNFIRILKIYKIVLVIFIFARFFIQICSTFLTCWLNSIINSDKIFNYVDELFIKRTINSDNRMDIIFDFIHLFIVKSYIQDLVNCNWDILRKKYTSLQYIINDSFMRRLIYLINTHFIHIIVILLILISFKPVHFLSIFYFIASGLIIVFGRRTYFNYKTKNIIRIISLFPMIIIFTKLIVQLIFCTQKPLIELDEVFLRFFLYLHCPNPNYLNASSCLYDILILLLFLIQNRIYLSESFNQNVLNYYIYSLESSNVSKIFSTDHDFHRQECQQKLIDKQEKIKQSVQALRDTIDIESTFPKGLSRNTSIHAVDHELFQKFYSYRDVQKQIIDDYSFRDIDDYYDENIKKNTSTQLILDSSCDEPQIKYDIPKLSFLQNFKTSIYNLYNSIMKYIKRINKKNRERQYKISSIIEDGKRVHHDFLLKLSIKPNSDFYYDNDYKIIKQKLPQSDYKYSSHFLIDSFMNIIEWISDIIIKNTDIFVYILLVINQIYSSSLISLGIIISYFFYPAISVDRQTTYYWRSLSLFILFSIFTRYIFSIFPFSTFFTCSFTQCAAPNRVESDGTLCIYTLFGVDGCDYSPSIELILFLLVQIHVFSLHYRGMLNENELIRNNNIRETSISLPLTNIEESELENSSLFNKIKLHIWKFIKKYETNICSLNPDFYIVLFLTQLGQWIVIAFYWTSFTGPSTLSGDITQIIKGSVIPVSFSILITLQSLFIIFDRLINLNRMRSIKLVYTLCLAIIIHIVVFFFVPNKTQISILNNKPVLIFYIFYMIYFYVSFIPVRNGYSDSNILPYSIAKYHNYYSILIIFSIIYSPFIYELDTVLRWFSSNTCLPFFKFIKVDEIFFDLHNIKSFRKITDEGPFEPSGTAFPFIRKLIISFFALIVFFVAMIFPLWLYSTGVTGYKSVLPSQIDFSISINGHFSLYESTVIKSNFKLLRKAEDIEEIVLRFPPDQQYYAKSVLIDYKDIGDLIYVQFPQPSYSSWRISEPSKNLLINDIYTNISNIQFRLRFKLHRETSDLLNFFGLEKTEGSFLINVTNDIIDETIFQQSLINAISGKTKSVLLPNFLPYMIRAEPSKPLYQFNSIIHNPRSHTCAFHDYDINDTLIRDEWWRFNTITSKKELNPLSCESNSSKFTFKPMGIFFFIDYLKPNFIYVFSPSRNVIALYIILITSVSTFIKKFFLNNSHLIMYQEIPNPDYILNLCRFIYRARWSGDLELEEFFISILFFIYRSPETLIRVTKLNVENVSPTI